MPGFADLALGAAPIAGGALLGVAAGNIKPPDLRAIIKQDQDLLDRIPEGDTERRANLQRTIDGRIDDLVAAYDKNQSLREVAMSYSGNWRDIVLFVCAVLFTVIWWNIDHAKHSNWMLLFVVMILVSVITGIYAFRGIARAIRTFTRRGAKGDDAAQ
ncbi:hypothetical protein NGTWS0302_25190 [Mycolicibacterium cyprinidarum]|uniref:DUF2721 domain-containing protein n=1 Tax=Mycolicibacterium cyprinidarum TaxID=2860311 RepID=A0ABQ4VD19_9MYCO|nr:hypothetical protein NGTWS0302_25190 [Mycolicibacterium sp. NGTWS0302]GJF17521.1 hypothetical protein NGTWS1702_24080 [Mycolicibacterium sp. NGTWSNA01]GJF18586.1 hypothetical protein NGTWS1803_07950 [Mycolicibacterium sp. NGTWS1803]